MAEVPSARGHAPAALAAAGARAANASPLLEAFAGCGDAVVALAPQRGIVLWNAAAERLLGWHAGDTLGRDCGALLHCRDEQGRLFSSATCPILTRARRGEPVPAQHLRVKPATSAERWVSMASVALHDDDGALCALVHVLQDITRYKTLEHFARRVRHEAAALLLGPDAEAPVRMAAPLTQREQEVLALLADGADTAAIAARLCVSRSTARKHVQSILRKLDAHRRLEAVAYAHRQHLLP